MVIIRKDLLIPSYKIDKNLFDLVKEIETLLFQFKPSKENSIYPLEYRTKYSPKHEKHQGLIKAYENMPYLNVMNKNDLFTINSLMVGEKINSFRNKRVFTRDVHNINAQIEYPDFNLIESAWNDLNNWYINCKDHILIKSCAYMFCFTNIHPFRDGNGRTGRYVLTSLMSKYNDKLRYFPFEELLNDRWLKMFQIRFNQDLYDPNLKKTGDNCYRLIYFFLSLLRNKLKEVVTGVKPATIFN